MTGNIRPCAVLATRDAGTGLMALLSGWLGVGLRNSPRSERVVIGNSASQSPDGLAGHRFILASWEGILALTSPVGIFAWGESPSQ